MDVIVWPGLIAGAILGIFVVTHFWVIGQPAGCSTGYGNLCGLVCKLEFFHKGPYQKLFNTKLWFLLGIPLGGFLSSLSAPEPWHLSFDMGMYDAILPQSLAAKALWLIFGGFLLGFGARLAGACMTGHALVGSAMLNPPSLLAGAVFFASATLTTQLIFGT